ncbi:MAG: hypothetical protein J6I49_05185 [Bacteroidales bacterium]|nr:hypothetical protein [Bacteroidales bacterium]
MKRQLNISDIVPLAAGDGHIAVRGNFVIIRSAAGIREQMVNRTMGDLLYIPMGRVLMVMDGMARLRINMQPCCVAKGTTLVIPENFYMEVLEVSADYDAQIK